jgi:glycosyltransferase involved in cell wall biosynthesis
MAQINPESQKSEIDLVLILSEMRDDSPWLVKLLEKASSKFKVFLVVIAPKSPDYLDRLGIDVSQIYITNYTKKTDFFRISKQLISRLYGRKVSIIHSHGFIAALFALTLGSFKPSSFVLTSRHHGMLHKIMNQKLPYLLDILVARLSDRVIVYSEKARSVLVKDQGAKKETILYLPLGVPIESFRQVADSRIQRFKAQHGLQEQEFVVGTNARFVDWKGLSDVLIAFRDFSNLVPHSKLIMINVAHNNSLTSFIENSELREKVSVYLAIDDVAAFYHSLNVFCHVPISGVAEPAGLVYLESIASGAECIFTLSGLLHEFRNDNDWHEVPYNSPDKILECLLDINRLKTEADCGTNRVLRAKSDGTQQVLDQFSLSKSVNAQCHLYESLLQQNH